MKKLLSILLIAGLCMPLAAQTDEGEAEYRQSLTEPADTVACYADSTGILPIDTLPYPQNIRQRIDTLIATARLLNTSQLGLIVYDLTADSAIYTYNHRQTMRPASTMKLVTAIAAIDKLGGAYQLRTSLYYTGDIANRTLTGDLVSVGGMDPAFGRDDLAAFVESLQRLGVDTIRGNIVADRSMKDDDLLGEGWCWDDDNPVLSPLLISRKDNFTERLMQALRDEGVVLQLSPYTSPLSPSAYRLPSNAKLVCTRTHTIDQILTKMMKDSDNLYAESMFYQLAASEGNRPAKAGNARLMIQKLIQKVGLAPADYKIADGSGLSLYNYLSPLLHVRLLRYAYRNPNVFEHLLPALPIAGEDGTLKNRMKGTAAAGNVRAKTGTVTCVSCLAGYCTTDNGHDLCFAIMNQGVLQISNARTFQDNLCRALCASTRAPIAELLKPVKPVVKSTPPKKASKKAAKKAAKTKKASSKKKAKKRR